MILVKWNFNDSSCCQLCSDLKEVNDVLVKLTYNFSDDLIVDEVVLERYVEE